MDPNRSFGDGDYDDGQIHPLEPGSVLDLAIRREPWLNHSTAFRRRWLRLINGPNIHFVGTIISVPRRQIQLTVILQLNNPPNRWHCETVISLNDFDRFAELFPLED